MSTADLHSDDYATAAGRAQLVRWLRVVRDQWPIVAILVLCLAGAAVAKSLTEEKQYRAQALLVYSPDQANTAFLTERGVSGTPSATDPQTAAVGRTTLQRLATGRRVRGVVEDDLGDVKEDVSATSEQDSNVITLTVEGPDPDRAKLVADRWGQAFVDIRAEDKKASYAEAIMLVRDQLDAEEDAEAAESLRQQLQTLEILEALQQSDVRLVQPASVPREPFAPRPVFNAILGAVAGLLVGFLIVATRHTLDRRLKTAEDAESAWGAPMLASVGRATPGEARAGSTAALRDSFDHLQASIALSQLGREPRVLAVTSAVAAEGKTTAAVGLASSLARNGRRVLLIDADFRRPSLSAQVGSTTGAGLSTVLSGRGPVTASEVSVGNFGPGGTVERKLHVMSCGPTPPNPYEFFSSPAMTDLLASLREQWEYVVLDCAPLLPVSDSVPLISRVDGVLIAVRLYHSRSDAVRRARQLCDRAGAQILGLAVAVPESERQVYGYGYGPEDYSAVAQNGSTAERERAPSA